MKFLTLHQPWAALIAVGDKTIETRSWSTRYRGPLAIHAGKTKADFTEPVWQHCLAEPGGALLRDELRPLALGALVAVCDLVDVLPIFHYDDNTDKTGIPGFVEIDDRLINEADVEIWKPATLRMIGSENTFEGFQRVETRYDQRPFGDYEPGRFAWLLDNVRALPEPIPMRGAQGLRDLPEDVEARLGEDTGATDATN